VEAGENSLAIIENVTLFWTSGAFFSNRSGREGGGPGRGLLKIYQFITRNM